MKNKYKIEAFDGNNYWFFYKNKIYKEQQIENLSDTKVYNIIENKYVKYYFPLLNRLLRTGIHNIIPIEKGYIVVVKKRFLIYNENNQLVKVFDIPRGSRPLRNSICVEHNYLFFGDYWSNKKREKAHVYRLNLQTYKLEVILSLDVRHIHFVVLDTKDNQLIIGTGDEDNESIILSFNYKTKEKVIIGEGSQRYRAVSIIQHNELVIWGTDAPDEQNYIYSYNRKTKVLNCIRKVDGPVYYSTVTKSGVMYMATTIEDKKEHKAILYSSKDGFEWIAIKEFVKDHWHEKYFGYGIIEFIHGQEKIDELYYNRINLYEKN